MSLKTLPLLLCALLTLSSLAPARGQTAQAADTLRPFQRGGKWGYIDSSGRVRVEPRFEWAEEFSEGLAAFESVDGKYGFVDETGRVVVEPKFDNWTEFSEGVAAVSLDFAWGYIDKAGAWVIPPRFASARPFHDGLALVAVPLGGRPVFPPGPEKRVFIDRTGAVRIEPTRDILNGEFSGGFAAVQFVTRDGVDEVIIDRTGKVVFEGDGVNLDGFREGLAPVKKGRKWGFIDASGAFVIEPRFDDAHAFSEGLAAVLVGEKWGFIDRAGQVVVRPKYDFGPEGDNHDFSEGLALVYHDDRCKYIDRAGKEVIKVRCSEGEKFVGGVASIHVGEDPSERRGYIDRRGRYVWGPEPFKYKSFGEEQSKAGKDEKDKKDKKDEEVLAPLTDEERALDPRGLVANQPDFVADLTFFYGEGFGGFGGGERVARKGRRYREESQFWLFIGEEGKPSARVFPASKKYDDLEPPKDARAGGANPFNPRTLAEEPDVTFALLGATTIDGHRCVKIEAVRKGKPEKIYLYAARDLKDLVVVAQVLDPPRAFVQRLTNVSLEVPEELVTIPPDYKPIEHDRWAKVETARVKYKGRESKDFVVFRAPGGELFVHVGDAPYAWSYLVRPREATVETAFQGLLVTRAGEYVWRTKEGEAFSDQSYRVRVRGPYDHPEDERVTFGKNSLKFRSNDYKKDGAMIEVRW
jgi:hypothetical protein